MMASTTVNTLLPPVKSVVVYKNGDPFFSGRRFIVNQRQVLTMEAFLNDVTVSIGAPLAVRTLYTPRHGHRVPDLDHIEQGAQYVAAGFEKFKKIDYTSLGLKRSPLTRTGEASQIRGFARPNVSAKWRKVVTLPCIIHVFRNGDVLSPAMRFIIPRSMLKSLEQILSLVSEKAMLRNGAVRRLCTLDGVTVTSVEELESAQYYVAVGAERFKKLPYVELLLKKAAAGSADRHYVADRGVHRRSENRKIFPQDSHSDSALLDTPERDGRRVKSTGDEDVTEEVNLSRPLQRRRNETEDKSVFYAKPVRVRKHRSTHRTINRATGQPSVFKAVGRRRDEVRGAEEVAEDETTAVELPIDQRVAEIVQDEEFNESQPGTNHMLQTEEPDEHMASSSLSPSDRGHGVKDDRVSDDETLPRQNASPTRETETQDVDIFSESLEHERDDQDESSHEAEPLNHVGETRSPHHTSSPLEQGE
ncbi:doublecortin domain-containing protein 2B [Trichomycterus rosablanca]|uniref:doublecortin domain-containing protein 2B n=1 Tax=Trichomycterus rosablanca TaxID=2290929 RepID=UPI002F35A5D3